MLSANIIHRIFGGTELYDRIQALLKDLPQWIHDYDPYIIKTIENYAENYHSPDEFYSAIRDVLAENANEFYHYAKANNISDVRDWEGFDWWVRGIISQVVPDELKRIEDVNLGPVTGLSPGLWWMDDSIYRSICHNPDPQSDVAKACELYRDGKHVLLSITTSGPLDMITGIVAVVDPKTGKVQGDPLAKVKVNALRVQRGLYEEPTIKSLQSQFGEEGVKPFMDAVRKVMPGIVSVCTLQGVCGGSYIGQRNGLNYFLTAAHCVDDVGSKVTITTAFGRIDGTVKYRGSFPYNDVAIVTTPSDPVINRFMKSIPIADKPNPYGVAITGWWREGDLLQEPQSQTPYALYYRGVNRCRKGYSGGPVINSLGQIVGTVSSGGRLAGITSLDIINKALKKVGW